MKGKFRERFSTELASTRDPAHPVEERALDDGDGADGDGPWLFIDPMERTWVLSTARLEYDPTLPSDGQVKALICNCDDGWLFAIPVGPTFRPEDLSRDDIARLLVVAEGDARMQSDWEPSRSGVRTVRKPATGRVFEVQVLARDWTGDADGGTAAPRPEVLLFHERGGNWTSSISLAPGTPMESLSRDDLLHLLWPALDLEPRTASPAFARSQPSDAPGLTGPPRLVLLVEDHRDLRMIYRMTLEQAGFGVVEAKNGEEALSLIEQYDTRLHAVISDVVMPRVGGRELLWRLSEQYPRLPVILMSGLLDHTQVTAGLESESAWFLRKPFAPLELVSLVQTVLGSPPEILPQ